MNKTRRRAVQKHRAKDQKFAARRKAENDMAGGARARAQMQAPAAPKRPRTAERGRPDATSDEGDTAAETTTE